MEVGINWELGVDMYTLLSIYDIDDQWGCTVQNKELYSILCNDLAIWEKNQKRMEIYIYIYLYRYIYISIGNREIYE